MLNTGTGSRKRRRQLRTTPPGSGDQGESLTLLLDFSSFQEKQRPKLVFYRYRLKRLVALLVLIASVSVLSVQRYMIKQFYGAAMLNRVHRCEGDNGIAVVFLRNHSSREAIFKAKEPLKADTSKLRPDYYANLTIHSVEDDQVIARTISASDTERLEDYRSSLLKAMAEYDLPQKLWHDDEFSGWRKCYRNSWGHALRPTCNTLHETRLDLPYDYTELYQQYEVFYKSSGYYRDVWLLVSPEITEMVLKKLRLHDDFDIDARVLHQVQTEAVIMERLTVSHRIIDIYGHCGISVLAQGAPGEVGWEIVPTSAYLSQEELNRKQRNDVHPMNNLTVSQKLNMAIDMAASLAEIHGFSGGVIVHGDVHPSQWLRTRHGHVRLNDFNAAEILYWNPWKEHYCTVKHHFGGSYRSPEELRGKSANEKLDVYAMGNNIYSLLTGLWPYYGNSDKNESLLEEKVRQGIRPYVDDRYRIRSIVERKLVDIMEDCWEFDYRKRITIFAVVRRLQHIRKFYDVQTYDV